MAIEIEHYTDSQGRACMRLRQVGSDDPPAPSNLARIRPGEVLASVMVPVAPSGPAQITEAERAVCRQLGVSESDYLETKRRQPNKWASEPLEH